ncbi:exosome complex protein Rrp42 [Candidatus Woesearchaeota archaeon]|nr:exosome complex protein Rrp42 [Candidatus Woesearchaeota archaeon]
MNAELRNHIIELLDKGTRLDGRSLLDYRKPVKVEYDASNSAEGSARITIGDTELIVGIKMEVSTPYPDTPDQGGLMVNTELLPLSNPEFESGPPSIEAIELSRVVDRGIRESKAIDMKKLCLIEGEKAWTVIIDICPINAAGNLFDASALGALAALKNAKFPKLGEGEVVDYSEKTDEALPLAKMPVSVTVCKIGSHFIIDPTTEEEKVIDARLTVATDEKNQLCALQKGGDYPLTIDDISKMLDIGVEKCNELRKAL